ncbi:MAG TPA: hypothetical protein EYH41_04485 [Novosphingobium capsulatum]|nr:hypothetical protein [Novosphingobium aromaticivorans]HIQ17244.1 hypothetical protein [Novosphingobium capsulatum]
MAPEDGFRAFDSHDASLHVKTLNTGDFLVMIRSGAVSIRTTIPAEQVAFLFPARPVERAA